MDCPLLGGKIISGCIVSQVVWVIHYDDFVFHDYMISLSINTYCSPVCVVSFDLLINIIYHFPEEDERPPCDQRDEASNANISDRVLRGHHQETTNQKTENP